MDQHRGEAMAAPTHLHSGRGAARRRPAAPRPRDLRWTRGRRLVLVDVENVVGGECSTEARARWAQRRLLDEIGDLPADLVVVAVDASGLPHVGWQWPTARRLIGRGRDGADRALLEV